MKNVAAAIQQCSTFASKVTATNLKTSSVNHKIRNQLTKLPPPRRRLPPPPPSVLPPSFRTPYRRPTATETWKRRLKRRPECLRVRTFPWWSPAAG